MDINHKLELSKRPPLAVFSSFVTNDGSMELPQECIEFLGRNEPISIVITNSYEDGVLWLLSLSAFEDIVTQLNKLNIMDSTVRTIKRLIIGHAINTTINGNRIAIDHEHQSSIGISTDSYPFPIAILKYPNKLEVIPQAAYEKLQFTSD